MSSPDSNHRKGLMLTGIGGLALSFDVPLIRLADGDSWSVLMIRTGATFVVALAIWTSWRLLAGNAPKLIPGWHGLFVAIFYGLGSICFTTAVFNTSTGNLVFILAFNTMFSAILSWLFLRERPPAATLVTMAVMTCGVFVIVSDSLGGGHLLGDGLALASAFFIACAITISRASGKDMGFTSLVGVFLPFLLTLFMVGSQGPAVQAPWWIIFNGAVIMPIAFFCLGNGPKYISGPEVAMFYLLETVLAPIWVWIVFSEVPSRSSLIGGTILIGALVARSLWQLSSDRRRNASSALRHPT